MRTVVSLMSESPPNLSNFFELTTDLMCVLNLSGDCLSTNSAFRKVLGVSSVEIGGQRLSDLTHPEDSAVNKVRIERFVERAMRTSSADKSSVDNQSIRMTFRHSKAAPTELAQPALGRLESQPSSLETLRLEPQSTEPQSPEPQVIWLEWRFVAVLSERKLYCMGRNVTQRVAQMIKSRGRYSDLLQTRKRGIIETIAAKQEVRLYAQAIHSIPIGLFILRLDDPCDPNSLSMVASNPEASACTGVDIGSFLGDRIVNIFPNIKGSGIPEIYAEVVRSAQPKNLGEVTYGDQRVKQSVFSVKAFPLVDNYLGVAFEDVTERKLREDDLVTANILLTDTMALLENRNQELDQFAYVTSHDLKAPLRAIANLATWIQEDVGDLLPAESQEQFELLKSRVSRMEGLINGLLTYSRVGRIGQDSDLVDVREMLDGIVDSLMPADYKTIEIDPHMPVIQTQKILLSQVFLNLIANAIDHHNRSDGHIKVSVQTLKESYEFAISDDGPGIDPAYHDKIFTIFQTLKARDDYESTGIGLSIVRKILSEVGGSISVDSTLGAGSTFRFTWPKKC